MREQFGAWLLNILIRAGIKRRHATPIHSKAASPRNRRLCLVPHTCRFLGQQSLGRRTNGEGLKSSPAPGLRFGERSIRQIKFSSPGTAFLRPRFANCTFAVEKRMAPTPLPMCRGQVARFCFLSVPLGTGKANAPTTPPAGAHNVTPTR
jgi:hypothetical protein